MILTKLNRQSSSFIGLSSILDKFNLNMASFLNMVEFNLMLQPGFHCSSFDINSFISDTYKLINNLYKKEIPYKYNPELLCNFDIRKVIVSLQGFSLISKDWVIPLSQWIGKRKVLEIMSGVGTLSKALKDEGIDVISTDNYTANNFDFSTLWTDVEQLDAIDSINKYGKDVDIIIMSWCYTDEKGYECLLKMRQINPNAIMIYIGEGPNGSTGSPSLYKNMIELSDPSIEKINYIYPKWDGVHDKLYLIK